MTSNKNYKQGLVKVYWQDVRDSVAKVEPIFTKLVDKLSPDKSFPIYLAYYPYGSVEADTESSLFPDDKGGFFRLTDASAPKDVCKHLGYSIQSAPLGMVLEKQLELYIDLKNEDITIPWRIYKPGMIFPFPNILKINNNRNYSPNGILSSSAGARSVFMLPNIGCSTNHSNLQRDLKIKCSTPKSLYDHWHIFKELSRSSEWRCCVMYFSEKWMKKLQTDKAWIELNHHLYRIAWDKYEYERNRIYYEMTFSMIQRQRNLKPNPYLADTARHLFAIAIGAAPGFSPAIDDEALPLKEIQKAYIESYNLKKYIPTIMTPTHFMPERDQNPIYYSLQNPSTRIFSPKSREVTNTIFELRELENIMRIFKDEFSKSSSTCSDTIMSEIAKHIEFSYYHCKPDRYQVISMTQEIPENDSRFLAIDADLKRDGSKFSSDAPFLRGCVGINSKWPDKQS